MQQIFLFIVLFVLGTWQSHSQKNQSLEELLWEEAGGRLSDMNADEESRTTITDDTANGYLRVYNEEQGCGCPFETTVAGYKEANGGYTVLKTYWDGCGSSRTLSSNKDLNSILPKDFGLQTFLPKLKEPEYRITSAVFYLKAEIPRKGTDTQLNLTYIPFGVQMASEKDLLGYEYKQITNNGETNYIYSEALQTMLQKISGENTLECLLWKSIDDIIPDDKKLIEKLCGAGKAYADIAELALQIRRLRTIYELSKAVAYKSVILGWDRDKARFFIKEKIKNDAPELSFLEFVRQLSFLKAVC